MRKRGSVPAVAVLTAHRAGKVLQIRLQRPGARNALDASLCRTIMDAFNAAEEDTSVRVVVLTGSEAAFCAGADLKELLADWESGTRPDVIDAIVAMLNKVRAFSKPVVGALNGLTIAGGLELALCCDVILAAESAAIGDAHVSFGVFPGGGAAALLPHRIGLHRTKALLFSGELLPAATWAEWGLVHRVVPDGNLEAISLEFAQTLARRSPLVLQRMKRVTNAAFEMGQAAALRNELAELRDHTGSADFREGLAAFVERRSPDFG